MGGSSTKVERKQFPRGNVYSGDMKGSKRHGKGTFTWAEDGMYYTGDWVKDQMHGNGTLTFRNGSVFTGGFYKNNIHGLGELKTATGEVIKGGFVFGRRFITTDGNKFPVASYNLDVDVIATDNRRVVYKGPAILHLFTGLLILPNMLNPNPETSVYEAAVVVLPVDSKGDANVAVIDATAVNVINYTNQPQDDNVEQKGTGVQFGVQDDSLAKEVRHKNDPNAWSFF